MANNPRASENLVTPKPGEVRNPYGRPKKLVNAIKSLPDDAQQKIYGVLAYALTLKDEQEAKKFLEAKKGELGQYGFVMQIAIKQLVKDGWGFGAMMDIMDRLYGKPKQQVDATHTINDFNIIVRSQGEADKLINIANIEG